MDWYMQVLRKYAVFSGRARRSEFWFFTLINTIISVVLQTILMVVGGAAMFGLAALSQNGSGGMPSGIGAGAGILGMLVGVVWWLYCLAIIIPSWAVSVRRLHDTGRSGWLVLLSLIPVIGAIVLLIFMVEDSKPGENQWGPNPKAELSL